MQIYELYLILYYSICLNFKLNWKQGKCYFNRSEWLLNSCFNLKMEEWKNGRIWRFENGLIWKWKNDIFERFKPNQPNLKLFKPETQNAERETRNAEPINQTSNPSNLSNRINQSTNYPINQLPNQPRYKRVEIIAFFSDEINDWKILLFRFLYRVYNLNHHKLIGKF